MAKLALAYPELDEKDFNHIQSFREKHDILFYKMACPHFTLLISNDTLSKIEFKEEIRKKSERILSFEFILRSAVLNRDPFNGGFNVFLVPDEGGSRIVKMQESLHSGKLREQRLSSVDLNPNIGVGSSNNFQEGLKMAEVWNQSDFEIKGKVSVLDLVEYDGTKVETFERIRLIY